MLKSLKVSGSYKAGGNARIYLEEDGIRHLIFDSDRLDEEDIVGITGFAISINETEVTETDEISLNDTLAINQTDSNKTEEKAIDLSLEYKKDTIYDECPTCHVSIVYESKGRFNGICPYCHQKYIGRYIQI